MLVYLRTLDVVSVAFFGLSVSWDSRIRSNNLLITQSALCCIRLSNLALLPNASSLVSNKRYWKSETFSSSRVRLWMSMLARSSTTVFISIFISSKPQVRSSQITSEPGNEAAHQYFTASEKSLSSCMLLPSESATFFLGIGTSDRSRCSFCACLIILRIRDSSFSASAFAASLLRLNSTRCRAREMKISTKEASLGASNMLWKSALARRCFSQLSSAWLLCS
mmetsp:Transcript_46748/g.91991  ORF Transcript_46748/g.91991 Transcript_46748/m.91991 type:complete len:223 (-) Transcript_46748:550-1218(-)